MWSTWSSEFSNEWHISWRKLAILFLEAIVWAWRAERQRKRTDLWVYVWIEVEDKKCDSLWENNDGYAEKSGEFVPIALGYYMRKYFLPAFDAFPVKAIFLADFEIME